MFPRKKKNRTGTISVVVIDKSNGYKEVQRIIDLHGGINLSVDKALDIAKTIPTIKIQMPYNNEERTQTLFLTDKQKSIKPLFDIKAILKGAGG